MQLVEVLQLLAEEQVVHVADEGVAAQVLPGADRFVRRQVLLRRIQAQRVVGELGHHHRPARRAFERDHDVGLAPRQVHQARHREQVDGELRVPYRERRELRRQHHRAEAFGRADAHQAREAFLRGRRGAFHRQEGALHRLDLRLQPPARLGEPVATGFAREERGADLLFERLDPPRHRGVVDLQPPRRAHQRARAGQLQEVPQVVPVHVLSCVRSYRGEGSAFLQSRRAILSIVMANLQSYDA